MPMSNITFCDLLYSGNTVSATVPGQRVGEFLQTVYILLSATVWLVIQVSHIRIVIRFQEFPKEVFICCRVQFL